MYKNTFHYLYNMSSYLFQKTVLFIYQLILKITDLIAALYCKSEGMGFTMTRPYLTLIKTQSKFSDGTYKCELSIWNAEGIKEKTWIVCTGQGYAQNFRKAGRNIPGSMEPLPQGDYQVFDIAWAGGKDNWEKSHGAGLGPVFVPVVCPEEKRRGEFGIHLDYNRGTSPGTAGCIGVIGQKDMRDIVDWLRKLDPKILKVNWGL
jgi:lysozyme